MTLAAHPQKTLHKSRAITVFLILSAHLVPACRQGRFHMTTEANEPTQHPHFTESAIREVLDAEAPRGRFPESSDLNYCATLETDEEELIVVTSELLWGNNRLTKRIIILSGSREYLGNYQVDDLPIGTDGTSLIFPYKENLGNKIDFSSGQPPSEIYLDGLLRDFEAHEDKRQQPNSHP